MSLSENIERKIKARREKYVKTLNVTGYHPWGYAEKIPGQASQL